MDSYDQDEAPPAEPHFDDFTDPDPCEGSDVGTIADAVMGRVERARRETEVPEELRDLGAVTEDDITNYRIGNALGLMRIISSLREELAHADQPGTYQGGYEDGYDDGYTAGLKEAHDG